MVNDYSPTNHTSFNTDSLNAFFNLYEKSPNGKTFAILLSETDRNFVKYAKNSGIQVSEAQTLATSTSNNILFDNSGKRKSPEAILEDIENSKVENKTYAGFTKSKIRSAVIKSKKKTSVDPETVNPDMTITYENEERGIITAIDNALRQKNGETDFIIEKYTKHQLYNILLIFHLWHNRITNESLAGADIKVIKDQIRGDIYKIKNTKASNFCNQVKRIRDDEKIYKASLKMIENWNENDGLSAEDIKKFHNRAKDLQLNKEFTIAKGIWRTLIQVIPEKSKLYHNIRSNIALTEKRTGNNQASFDEYLAIIAKIQERIKDKDNYPWASNVNLARMYNQLGVIKMLERDYDRALPYFKSAHQYDSTDSSYIYNVFEILLMWKQTKSELSKFVAQEMSEEQIEAFKNYVEKQIQKLESVNHPTNTYYYILNFIIQLKN